ncbi:VWA domain-containing protein [Elioraea rosea]|uniref:VWA domain-containing protein n=1 Tax=Elioraea rosea TaxID=2492390 RepID=UPI0019527AB8|nr:VWA domain-containing protein [Elioraea rosea]
MKNPIKFAAAVAVAMSLATGASAAIRTDIVFVVDESGSMGTEQVNLRNNIGLFASILSAGGVDATYALVGYGNSAIAPRLITDFTNPSAFATAATGLQTSGTAEVGYSAITFALNGIFNQSPTLSFRPNSLKNIVIVSDDGSNNEACISGRAFLCIGGAPDAGGTGATQASVDALLKANNALLNAVISGSAANGDYAGLATGNGGQVFNLTGLGGSDPTATQIFVDAFARAKLQEIIDTCETNPNLPGCNPGGGETPVPEPGTLALLGAGLLGLGVVRRRKAA